MCKKRVLPEMGPCIKRVLMKKERSDCGKKGGGLNHDLAVANRVTQGTTILPATSNFYTMVRTSILSYCIGPFLIQILNIDSATS